MQQTTILQTPRRSGMPAWQKDVIGLVVALVALGGIWLGTQRLLTPAPARTEAVAPLPRRFADEAAYTPSAGEYLNLGEDYLPLTSAPHAVAVPPVALPRRFADEAAYLPSTDEYVALGESYLPLTNAPHAVAVPPVALPRRFADEAAYTPSASDYASMGESYLTPGVATQAKLR